MPPRLILHLSKRGDVQCACADEAEVSNKRGYDAEMGTLLAVNIREAVRSGISIPEVCRKQGLKEGRFYWW